MEGLKNTRAQKGFTLLEMMVVLGILAILAGIVGGVVVTIIPYVKIIGEKGSIRTISTEIDLFEVNNGQMPTRKDAYYDEEEQEEVRADSFAYTLLFTGMNEDGTPLEKVRMINENGLDVSEIGALDIEVFPLEKRSNIFGHLVFNLEGYNDKDWKGYLKSSDNDFDKWGNSRIIAFVPVEDQQEEEEEGEENQGGWYTIYIISAGPNGSPDTYPGMDFAKRGDDIATVWPREIYPPYEGEEDNDDDDD